MRPAAPLLPVQSRPGRCRSCLLGPRRSPLLPVQSRPGQRRSCLATRTVVEHLQSVQSRPGRRRSCLLGPWWSLSSLSIPDRGGAAPACSGRGGASPVCPIPTGAASCRPLGWSPATLTPSSSAPRGLPVLRASAGPAPARHPRETPPSLPVLTLKMNSSRCHGDRAPVGKQAAPQSQRRRRRAARKFKT